MSIEESDMETITDRAAIRATDEHDERTTPAPSPGAGLDLDAIEARWVNGVWTLATPDIRALVAKVRDLTEENASYADELLTCDRQEWYVRAESAEAEVVTLRDTLTRRTDSHTQLRRDNDKLRAKVAAVERLADDMAKRAERELGGEADEGDRSLVMIGLASARGQAADAIRRALAPPVAEGK
jgi:hypothetical protein